MAVEILRAWRRGAGWCPRGYRHINQLKRASVSLAPCQALGWSAVYRLESGVCYCYTLMQRGQSPPVSSGSQIHVPEHMSGGSRLEMEENSAGCQDATSLSAVTLSGAGTAKSMTTTQMVWDN